MKQVSILLVALLCLKTAAAQTAKEVRTIVTDSFKNEKMTNASIVITRASDSIIMVSGRTNINGSCRLSLTDSGMYILNVLYPGYADYSEKIWVSGSQQATYLVALMPIAHLLEEVIVKNEVAKIRMKGDTIEFRADSFVTDLNASVEDLLKKLPGISVDSRGNIKAYGKRVERVLIGGEEYFSEDPTLVTRSLRSNIVQKVQVFDKASDQAAFSKINDGRSVKAINLELKPDKKKGYFGKAEGGTTLGSFYHNQFLVTRFNGDQKFAAFLIHSNVGTTGLSWQDTRTYSDFSLTTQESSGFTNSQTSSLENWDGTYQNQGIPFVTSMGGYYSDKPDKNLLVNANYRYYAINLDLATTSDQQFILDNRFYRRKQLAIVNNNARSHRGILKTTIKFSKNSDLLIGLDLNTGNKTIDNGMASSLYVDTINKLNAQARTLQVNGTEKNFNGSVLWRSKFTSGSTLSVSGKVLTNRNAFSGYLASRDSLFQNNQLLQDTITDQYKTDAYHSLAYNAKAIFSVPLNIFSSVLVTATFTHNYSVNALRTFNKNGSGYYTAADEFYSSSYELSGQNATAGIGYNLGKGKVLLNAMVDGGISSLDQNTANKAVLSKIYLLLFPTATLTYSFNRQHKLIIDYTGTTLLPQLKQLQPVQNNIDPLNQMTGNPGLAAAFRSTFNVQYYNFKTASDVSISAGGVFSFDRNGFSTREMLDLYGKRTYAAINVSGNKRISFFSNYTCKPFHKLFDLSISATANATENAKIINSTNISTRTLDYGLSIAPSFYRQDKINLEYRASFRRNTVFSYAPTVTKQDYTTIVLQPSISVNLLKYTILKSDYYYSKFPFSQLYGEPQTISILNASVSQQLFKQRKVTLQLFVKDIFNTNRGLNRNVYENYVSQTSYNTISRYFMLSVIYNFSHTPKTK